MLKVLKFIPFLVLLSSAVLAQSVPSGGGASGGGGSGTVGNGTAGQLAIFNTSGTAVQGFPTGGINRVYITDSSGNTATSTALPGIVQSNISILGTIGIGLWQGSIIGNSYGGTGLSSYTQGCLIYAPSSSTLACNTTLAGGQPVFGGALGPPTAGTKLGTTTQVVTATGTFTPGNGVKVNSNLDLVDSGAPPSTGSGTVNNGVTQALAVYNSTSAAVSPLTPMINNGVLTSNAASAPVWSQSLPLVVQGNIVSLGVVGGGTWQATPITGPYGGTGLTSFTPNGILWASSATSLASTGALGTGLPIIGGVSGPTTGTKSGGANGFVTYTGSVPTGSCPQATGTGDVQFSTSFCGGSGSGTVTSGVSGQLTFYAANGTTVSGLPGITNTVMIANGSGAAQWVSTLPLTVQGNITNTGAIVGGAWQATPIGETFGGTGKTSYTSGEILYASSTTTLGRSGAFSAGLPMLWGGTSAPTSGTKSGSTSEFGTTVPGTKTVNKCLQWDVVGNVIESSLTCNGNVFVGSEGGTANARIATVSTGGFTSLYPGVSVLIPMTLTNTGATTLNVNSTGVKNVLIPSSSGPIALTGGELIQNNMAMFTYDGTQWQLVNPPKTTRTTVYSTTGSFSHTFQPYSKHASIILHGAGGAGGAGMSTLGNGTGGGGGGGGQIYASGWVPVSSLGTSPISLFVPSGGTATSGNGNAGGTATFGSLFRAPGGAGGSFTAITTALGGSFGSIQDSTNSNLRIGGIPVGVGNYGNANQGNNENAGGNGGQGASAAAGSPGRTSYRSAGGGAAGGGNTTVTSFAGAAGGAAGLLPNINTSGGGGGTGGAAGSGACTAGAAGIIGGVSGSGGGGGGGNILGTGAVGCAGGYPGGGGGGGGSSVTGAIGGPGADGYVVVMEN